MKKLKYLLITLFILLQCILVVGLVSRVLLRFGISLPIPRREETIALGFILFFLFIYRLVTRLYKGREDLDRFLLMHLLALLVLLIAYGVSANPTALIDITNNFEELFK